MNIVYKKVDQLKPYENNPRHNENAVVYVMNSIKDFGFKNPIIIDKDNVIVAGHTRWEASKRLGLEEVPCIVADDLTEEQIKAFRLADNKTAEIATWDLELLEGELENILDFDMGDYGFINSDIDWSGVDDLTEENYEEPKKELLQCPNCGHKDTKAHFVAVKE